MASRHTLNYSSKFYKPRFNSKIMAENNLFIYYEEENEDAQKPPQLQNLKQVWIHPDFKYFGKIWLKIPISTSLPGNPGVHDRIFSMRKKKMK